MNKKIATALLASALFPAAAYAQGTTTTPETTTPPAATDSAAPGSMGTTGTGAMEATSGDTAASAAGTGAMASSGMSGMSGPFVTVPPTGAWRTSDLDGKNVEDANGESIGSISDTLVNENGEVIAVLVGVGGFLGIGAKDVAVSMEALEFGPGAMAGLSSAPAADAAPAGGTMGATTTGAAAPAAGDAPAATTPPVVGEDNLPDRIVLNVTREELEAATAYGEPEDTASDADMTGAATTGGMAPAGGATTGGMAPAGGTAPAGTAPAQ